MKRMLIFSVVVIAVFYMPALCLSDDSYGESDTLSFFVGEKTWFSTGNNEWNIAGTTAGGPPDILSELEYLGVESTVYEIYGGIHIGRGAVILGYGFGDMHGGIYRDSDYLRDNRQGLFSLSTGDADGDLYYWNVEYNYRVIAGEAEEKPDATYMDVFIGFQKWHEKVRMTNGVQEFGGVLGPFSGLNSTYEFIWKSYRIGFGGGLPLYKGFGLKGRAILIPYNEYKGKGIWNLRTDFKQDPSFEHKASRGRGAQLEASLSFMPYPALNIGLGYRYWYIKSGKGEDITYSANGTIGITQFNEAVSERQGPFLDINYTF